MSGKYIVLILAVAIMSVVAAFVLTSGGNSPAQSAGQTDNSVNPVPPLDVSGPTSSFPTAPTPTSGSTQAMDVVTYTDSGFSPKTLTVKAGTTVVFKNAASDAVWPASNPHPLHNGYPTTGGCVASTFDACAQIQPGGSWSFKFDIKGSWGYHNHMNPSEGGTIVVE